MKHATPRRLAVVAAAAFLGAGLTAAVAQPMGHAGYGGGDVVGAIARVKSELNLDTSQQAMWDSAVAASKSARAAMRSNRDSVRAALNAELAKPEPDLAAVSAAADSAQTQSIALRHQARAAWLNLYGTFTPGQKAVVKTQIQNRLARADEWRAKMLQRHGSGQ
ncbi:MAG: periplasmic heavy metal sensor [Proteobacteria bacterium]|jgi:Spy/CpxP family protein refolding chaperone|nr:periplasmic heavy metal sensor [Pseudomonadota bacterium]